MKTSAFLLVLLILARRAPGQEAVRPLVAVEFGKQITVQAEFVAKGRDYYSQNLVPAPYTLKVLAVNGRSLKEPVLIEYKLQSDEKTRAKIERLGIPATLEAYESLYQPSMATPWLGVGEQGTAFALVHILYVRPQQKKG